jgi:enoyl-[acyl-carrier-protein] reductase (NADH)
MVKLKNDLRGKAVVITGGTKGLGLASGLALAREGAEVYLTHKWGSVEDAEVQRRFAEAGALRPPVIVEADAAEEEDTARLLGIVKERHARVEVFISNVSFAQAGGGLDSYSKRSFLTSLGYSAWPMLGHLQQMKQLFGQYPRYTLGMSCDGPETYYPGYDYVAAAKTVMETMTRYLASHFLGTDCRINILRSRPVSTDSLRATFGEGFEPFLRRYHGDDYFIEVEQVADAVLALVSGLLDGVSGQVILLDKGVAFCDNLMRLYEERDRYDL